MSPEERAAKLVTVHVDDEDTIELFVGACELVQTDGDEESARAIAAKLRLIVAEAIRAAEAIARAEGRREGLGAAADRCATFVRERIATAERIEAEPPELRGDRATWVRIKQSEAQRCVDAIRALAKETP